MSAPDTSSGAPVTADALLARGYREYPPLMEACERLLQKAVADEAGKLYFVTFREWRHRESVSYDAQLACDTDTGGYLWATVREDTIEATEARIEKLWREAGGVRYDC